MSTQEVIRAYYASLEQHDDRWQDLYSEDAAFSDASHTLNSIGRDAVLQSFIPFLKPWRE
jgi:hypothetical protein